MWLENVLDILKWHIIQVLSYINGLSQRYVIFVKFNSKNYTNNFIEVNSNIISLTLGSFSLDNYWLYSIVVPRGIIYQWQGIGGRIGRNRIYDHQHLSTFGRPINVKPKGHLTDEIQTQILYLRHPF